MNSEFKKNVNLNRMLIQACSEDKRKSLKESADVWYNRDPDKVEDMIRVMTSMKLMDGVPDGFILGSNSTTPSTGTYIFYRTESEIETIILNAVAAKPKGWATGQVLEKMAANRILMLHRAAKSVDDQIVHYANGARRLAPGPTLPEKLGTPEINTINYMEYFYNELERVRSIVGGAWDYHKKLEEMPEFFQNPNLTDDHVERGMGHASAAIVIGE